MFVVISRVMMKQISEMNSVIVLVLEKRLYIQFVEILKEGKITILNELGTTIQQKVIKDSHYEVINFEHPKGKYFVRIDSDRITTNKSIHIK